MAVLRAIYEMHMPIAPMVKINIKDDISIIFQPAPVDDFRAVACVKNRACFDICSPTDFKSAVVLNSISHIFGK